VIDSMLAGRYEIQRQFSRKAGRRTFLAQDMETLSLVIIKILRFDAEFQWDDLKLFEREAQTLQQLEHPAIPQYLDYFEVDEPDLKGFALVQTYIPADSLESWVQQGRKFSEVEIVKLADRLLTILTYLHSQNPPVIHRDINPSNILVANRSSHSIGDVYLVDFGSVQIAASKETGTITIVGSYGYIPLEQFGGQTTAASDLYSLGMTLIYLITGIHPVDLVTVNGQVKFNGSHLSGRLVRWLEKMTQPYADRRFTSAQSARSALLSSDGSSGDFLHLRPADSTIMLQRDQESLEIQLTSLRSSDGRYDLWSALLILLLYFLPMFATLCWGWLAGLGSVLLMILLWNIYSHLLDPDGGICHQMLLIDRKMKTLNAGQYFQRQEIVKWRNIYQPDRPIDLVAYYPKYNFDSYFYQEKLENNPDLVRSLPRLTINRGRQEFSISHVSITEAELYWIGQEISDFLALELQVIYPKPQVF
jgi:serine/threonine protein kinase